MTKFRNIIAASAFGTLLMAAAANAETFNIPRGTLSAALDAYTAQSGVDLAVSAQALKGVQTKGVAGQMSAEEALARILSGTGFSTRRAGNAIAIVRDERADTELPSIHEAVTAAPTVSGAALETVTVTSSKIGGDVQNIPISITALSQEQLTATQTAGGPDLVKQVPNMTFTKTNFSGYSIQLRGIGTQAISVTTDPAVAVAFNDIPFIRNHFFEQEFYDVANVEVLRGPQGTLYGRNATAGVVNLASAKPTDQFEAMASLDVGNYGERRPEGMINIPIVDDRLDVRVAGEWTKRQGYSLNEITNDRIDGRDLWSSRVTLGWNPVAAVKTTLVWEHFSEDDDRIRSSKQLCKTDPGPAELLGVHLSGSGSDLGDADKLSQGCLPSSLYSPDAFEVPNGQSLAYFSAISFFNYAKDIDPYLSTTQSQNLRVIESTINPSYRAKNDIVELTTDYNITPALTFTSQTGFNHDFLWSTQDYNRFNTSPGIFLYHGPAAPYPCRFNCPIIEDRGQISLDGFFCDPQLGCSNRLVAQDLSQEHAWQLSQEFRLTSNFNGPFNFSAGANYLHYETEENYFVFINALTLVGTLISGRPSAPPYVGGVSDNHECLGGFFLPVDVTIAQNPLGCGYIDPNPIPKLNDKGHNYFLSQNPYVLNSYAGFGESYYNVKSDLKLTAGLRWTEDQKHFLLMPSMLLLPGWGYPVTGAVNQNWGKFTGRLAANWTPKLDFTDQTLIYASYAHGYKAGGANPPGAILLSVGGGHGDTIIPIHPLTFKPEFVDAFELGSKNTLLDGALTLNADVFYYNYENYQISEIVDRTSINLNFDTHVKGAEVEGAWEPLPGLRFNFAGGWEDTALAKGSQAIDLMDRTAGNPNWVVVKPSITQASNCIIPAYVIAADPDFALPGSPFAGAAGAAALSSPCGIAYGLHLDPQTNLSFVPNPVLRADDVQNPDNTSHNVPAGYPGFDPSTAPNNGEGFDKNISGKELPNAPPFTVSLGAQYTIPLSSDWAGTLRSDYYWQDYSWARVFNDNPYDRLRGYTNVNLTLIFTNQNGWQVMLYDKNIFNETAITGDFLNSDDSGLTTNVFLTDPKLIGVRVTKNW